MKFEAYMIYFLFTLIIIFMIMYYSIQIKEDKEKGSSYIMWITALITTILVAIGVAVYVIRK